MMSAPEVMPQTMQSFQYLNYAAQYQQQRLNFANGYPQAGHGLQDVPSVSAHDTLSAMNPVSVSTPSVLDPATQLGHLNAAITKLEPQIPPPSFPTSSSPHHQPQEQPQRLPMTPPRSNPMEPLVESFYEKDVEEELEEHFKKSQSETKKRKGLIFPASFYQQQTSPGRPSSGIGSLTSSSLSTTPPYGHYSGFPGYGSGPTSFSPHASATPTTSHSFSPTNQAASPYWSQYAANYASSFNQNPSYSPSASYNSSLNLTAGVGTYNQTSLFPSQSAATSGLDQLGANQSPFQAAAAGFRSY